MMANSKSAISRGIPALIVIGLITIIGLGMFFMADSSTTSFSSTQTESSLLSSSTSTMFFNGSITTSWISRPTTSTMPGCTIAGQPGGLLFRVLSNSTLRSIVGAQVLATNQPALCNNFPATNQTSIKFMTNGTEWYPLPTDNNAGYSFIVTYSGENYTFTASLRPVSLTCATLYIPSGRTNVTITELASSCSSSSSTVDTTVNSTSYGTSLSTVCTPAITATRNSTTEAITLCHVQTTLTATTETLSVSPQTSYSSFVHYTITIWTNDSAPNTISNISLNVSQAPSIVKLKVSSPSFIFASPSSFQINPNRNGSLFAFSYINGTAMPTVGLSTQTTSAVSLKGTSFSFAIISDRPIWLAGWTQTDMSKGSGPQFGESIGQLAGTFEAPESGIYLPNSLPHATTSLTFKLQIMGGLLA